MAEDVCGEYRAAEAQEAAHPRPERGGLHAAKRLARDD